MAKGNRGGKRTSGGGSAMYDVLNGKSFDIITKQDLQNSPLTGTPKQIAWAETIRKDLLKTANSYATQRTSDGRPSGIYKNAIQGKKAIINDIENNALVKAASNATVKAQKKQNTLNSYIDLSNRLGRAKSLLKKTDSRFWIDNRQNSKAIKDVIDGKTPTWY